jgi:thymidylate synthase (FAD)
MDAWRQMVRHRTASINERSTRYTEALTRFYRRGKNWNKQSLINKQGSADPVDENVAELLNKNEKELHKVLLEEYQRRLSLGVSKEQARKDLPLSTYTEAIWKIDLHNLLHFLKLRLSNDAQYEIRTYAQKIKEFVSVLFPITHKAFEEHHLFSTTFSRKEFQILKNYIDLETLLKNHKHEFDEKELFEFISKIK